MLEQDEKQTIDLATPLSLASSFRFPLQSPIARREVLTGALWLLIPGVGWVLNMGHRVIMVHQMMRGQPAWPAWQNVGDLFRHGIITLAGMMCYYAPALALALLALASNSKPTGGLALAAFLLATLAIPGFMSHYCQHLDPREIFNPIRATKRCLEGGSAYWHAWGIAVSALALSFLGLLAFGIGFLVTSVWFWQVAGFSFARVFARRFALGLASDQESRFLNPSK